MTIWDNFRTTKNYFLWLLIKAFQWHQTCMSGCSSKKILSIQFHTLRAFRELAWTKYVDILSMRLNRHLLHSVTENKYLMSIHHNLLWNVMFLFKNIPRPAITINSLMLFMSDMFDDLRTSLLFIYTENSGR